MGYPLFDWKEALKVGTSACGYALQVQRAPVRGCCPAAHA